MDLVASFYPCSDTADVYKWSLYPVGTWLVTVPCCCCGNYSLLLWVLVTISNTAVTLKDTKVLSTSTFKGTAWLSQQGVCCLQGVL